MTKIVLPIHLSYAQLCIFLNSLAHPFNDWSERNISQGFVWRPGSVSFRALVDSGDHVLNIYIDDSIPSLSSDCIRAIMVPFEIMDGKVEFASISDSKQLEIPAGVYSLQVEFLKSASDRTPEVNIRLNKGDADFEILRADKEMKISGELELAAKPAI